MILFCPILLYSARFEGRQKGTNTVDAAQTIAFMPVNGFQPHNTGKKKIRKYRLVEDLGWPRRAFDFYCHLLTSKYFTILLLLLMGIYWYFAAIGVLQIQTRLDAKKVKSLLLPLLFICMVDTILVSDSSKKFRYSRIC